ncbi:MAG: penicillin-binding protein activator [Gammaproteobacteria bacterium]|nr:penicillin-binding protein activator [Gammaproteobacteria bacterium]
MHCSRFVRYHSRGTGLALVLIIATVACTPQQAVRERESEIAVDAHAQALLAAGDYAAAATAYSELAAHSESNVDALRFRLGAADAWLRAGDATAAGTALDGARVAKDTPADLRAWRMLLDAGLALGKGQNQRALELVTGIHAKSLPAEQRNALILTRARALAANDDHLAAARNRAELAPALADASARADNEHALWGELNRTDPAVLAREVLSPGDGWSGWVELALGARRSLYDSAAFQGVLAQWTSRYPGHPALTRIVPELLEAATALDVAPTRVAMLLPLVGQYAGAGTAVRDGFLAAWYADAGNPRRPPVSIYDAALTNITDSYDRARADGADLIVGPLEKAALERLVREREIDVTLLALNQLDQPPATSEGAALRLYEFGLSPEDEARQAAERAWFDGRVRALAIAPQGDWGTRVTQAFASRWQELGGELLETVRYSSDTRDFATPSEALLNIDASKERAAALERLLQRRVHLEPRRRQDADLVFMAAFPVQARQIRPQLEYFNAGDLPVYATSHVFTGSVDLERDRDLNGIVFGDMPWLVDSRARDVALYSAIQRDWPDAARAWPRLYALGIDAYRLLPQLGRLRVQHNRRFTGQTGMLSMDARGRVQRQLTWVRFEDGAPRLVDPVLAGP